MKLWARFRRFWHCLFHLHRAIDVTWQPGFKSKDGFVVMGKKQTIIACECGREWM